MLQLINLFCRRYFQRACIAWGRQKKLGNDFVNAVIAHGEDEKLDMAVISFWLLCNNDWH